MERSPNAHLLGGDVGEDHTGLIRALVDRGGLVVIHGSKCRDMVGGGRGKVDLPRTMNKGWGWGY